VIKIEPNLPEAWYNMGYIYSEKGEYNKAIKCYKKAIKIKPNYAEAWYNMGVIYYNKGEDNEAIRCYNKVIEIKEKKKKIKKEVK